MKRPLLQPFIIETVVAGKEEAGKKNRMEKTKEGRKEGRKEGGKGDLLAHVN